MCFKLAGSVNFLSNLIVRLWLSLSGLRWVGQIGTGSNYNKKWNQRETKGWVCPSTWPVGQPVGKYLVWLCGPKAVQFGREGRKHLLTEREPEANNMCVWSLCLCVRMCACTKRFSIKTQRAFPSVSGRPGHGPLSSGPQTQTPCSFL